MRKRIWNKKSCRIFEVKVGKMGRGKEEIEKEWERVEEKLKEAIIETEREMRKEKIEKRRW